MIRRYVRRLKTPFNADAVFYDGKNIDEVRAFLGDVGEREVLPPIFVKYQSAVGDIVYTTHFPPKSWVVRGSDGVFRRMTSGSFRSAYKLDGVGPFERKADDHEAYRGAEV